MTKPINWFEIPAVDFDRARTFYESVFQVTLTQAPVGAWMAGVFPFDRATATGGCIQSGPGSEPSPSGVVIYLDGSPSIDELLVRVGTAGGRVSMPRTELPHNIGAIAQFIDSEGNRIGVHTPPAPSMPA